MSAKQNKFFKVIQSPTISFLVLLESKDEFLVEWYEMGRNNRWISTGIRQEIPKHNFDQKYIPLEK